MSSVLSQFAAEVAKAPNYSSVYNVSNRTLPSSVPLNPIMSKGYSMPSSLSTDNISSLQGVENFFIPLNTSKNFSSIYSSVGQGESRAQAAANLAETPAVSDIPFGFANSLFENQLTPQASSSIVAKNNSNFLSDALGFLVPRVTQPQAQNVLNELGVSTGAGLGPGSSTGMPGYSSSNTPIGNYVTPDTLSNPNDVPATDPSQQQQRQQQQQQGGGVLGSGGSSTTTTSGGGGILAAIEGFIAAHPIAALAIGVGALLILGGGLGGGKRR